MDGVNAESVYDFVDGYYRDDKFASNYVLQFDKTADNHKKDIGNKKGDSFNLIVAGLGKVNWGNKTPKACIKNAEIAFSQNESGGAHKETEFAGMCAAWRYFFQ